MKTNYQIKTKNNCDSMSEIFYDKPFKHCTRAMPSIKREETLNV